MSPRLLALVLVVLVMPGCGAGPSPSPEPLSTVKPPTAPAQAVTPAPTASASETTPASIIASDPREASYLLSGLRQDIAASACTATPEHLPVGAVAGIVCELSSPIAAQVGAYLFRDTDSLDATYLNKLAEYGAVKSGVQPARDRGCAEGVASDRGYQASATGGLPGRIGCFENEEGYANIRVTWPESLVYVGVLGNDADIARLYEWSWDGRSPSDPGLAAWEPPDANPLLDLYAAFRPEGLRTRSGRLAFAADEEIGFEYQLVNRGPTELVVPLIDFYGDLFYLAGSEQTWVHRLGEDSSIPCVGSPTIDQEGRYAVSGQILAFPGPPGPRLAPGEGLRRDTEPVETPCYPTGDYVFTVEYRRLSEVGAIEPGVFGGPVLSSVSFTFEIGDM